MTSLNILSNPAQSMLWFDLDDTIWAMTDNSVVCLRELYDSQRLDRWFATPEEWDEVYHRINHELWSQYSRAEISRDFLRTERFARPLRIGGASDEEALEMSKALDKLYLELLGSKTALIDGARELLDALSERGYRMGIVTNGFREVQYNKMKSSDIEKYFDVVVLSDEIGINKPDRRFFDYAVSKASTEHINNIMIGDNYATDIVGALGAGWEAVWFTGGKGKAIEIDGKVTVCDTLAEVEKLFKQEPDSTF
ncbi:MAG: YjjG family noncanonical pyrimidine nucleotidase [Muribaculaceae bacterium]|nr:YjjG family noncanonical pyrimidine nucleotidase [Muribaculaceae bacterium]